MILGIVAVTALPRFLNYSVDTRIAVLETFAGQLQEVVNNVGVIQHVDGKLIERDGKTFIEYAEGFELLLTKEQLDGGEYCRAIGLIDERLDLNKDATSSDGKYRCKYENKTTFFIQDVSLSKEECFLKVNPQSNNSAPTIGLTCTGNTSECLCP
ncbi:hypothetical protein JCM19233_7511 [Vibrio astriarenae]|nr:hypothetical protein JCM19233_7511 [Vibrio sp. C7]